MKSMIEAPAVWPRFLHCPDHPATRKAWDYLGLNSDIVNRDRIVYSSSPSFATSASGEFEITSDHCGDVNGIASASHVPSARGSKHLQLTVTQSILVH
jgi:hypothetical protein